MPAAATSRLADVDHVRPVIGMEIHVELSTRSKMFSAAANPAHPDHDAAPPNLLIDPLVLALPGSLPVVNRAAVEMAMMVGLALRCRVAPVTKWDRKSYFYPDMPKAYQISQYDMPLCFDGAFDLPGLDERGSFDPERGFRRIGIIRAHLEEDAGKLLHEAPGGHRIDFSIVDLNRACTPLLEIVTQPDFQSADEAVAFARMLRNVCRFLGVTEGVMQKGHIRFEPNINTVITFRDGRTVTTPIVEVKNLNSFKSLRGAIEFELREQPARWAENGREHGPGAKRTRGWDDARNVTVLQREKEDAHDYRYFPDPDIPPLRIDDAWRERVRASIPELPMARLERYMRRYGLAAKEAMALVEERDVCLFYEQAVTACADAGVPGDRAGRLAANLVLQSGAKRANERGVQVNELGITPLAVGRIAALREEGKIGSNAADELFGLMCEPANADRDPEGVARERSLLIVRDDAALESWCRAVIETNAPVVEQIRGGKLVAVGRLVGLVMKQAGGTADAQAVRAKLLELIGVRE